MRTIGPVTLLKSVQAIELMLESRAREINEAYLAQDQELTINLSLKFQATTKGSIAITHKIKFNKDVVSDSDTTYADEKQMGLFEADEILSNSIEISKGAAGALIDNLREGDSIQIGQTPKLVKHNGKMVEEES